MNAIWQVHSDATPLLDETEAGVLGVTRADPYLVWAVLTRFADLGGPPPGFVPIAIETAQGTTARKLAETVQGKSGIWMSALYRHPAAGLENTRFCTAFVTAAFLDHLKTDLAGMIERFTLAMPVLAGEPPRSDPVPVTNQDKLAHAPHRHGAPKVVVVGACDDAIAFAHAHFYADAAGTDSRVRCFWNQDDPANDAQGLGYGREFLSADIHKRMNDVRRDGVIDEEALYRDAGATALARGWTHGTATLDLAAGVDLRRPDLSAPNPNRAPDPPPELVAVQFRQPGRTVRDTSGLWLDAQALDALRYIIARTRDIAGDVSRAFINMSYGYFAGPHDGTSMLECAMDELSQTQACSITLPAGNSNLDRCHGTLSIAKDATEELRWRVLPECLTPSFVEIWLPDIGDSSIEVAVRPPGGGASAGIQPGSVAAWTLGSERLCTVVHLGRGARGKPPMILVALAPTMTRDPNRRPAPSGDWMIELKNANQNSDIEVQAWVQRNETPFGFPVRGRQSRFDDDAYVRFDKYTAPQDYDGPNPPSWIRREGTLSSIATGFQTCVVGGYRKQDLATAPYSSSGFDRAGKPPDRAGPDVAAVSDRSIIRKGVMAAGTRSGSALAFEGTSAAAPQILRKIAVSPPQGATFSTTPRQDTRNKATLQTITSAGVTEQGRKLDADERGRRVSQGNVGAGIVKTPPTDIEDR
ncbi:MULTISPECIES: hypothetical protein [unclassified Caballeronia]|uniref:hypothetical protein n=1 Tax=unclassified Caballeronia TaxID=2646786 RepID=UPI002028C4B8|nr:MULTISPECIES: hypothetical protein [unclassified Caballeronia]MDR5767699.1 hypothetical protein [Caballeronia sp. LZ028]